MNLREIRALIRVNPLLKHDPFIRNELRRLERMEEVNSMHPMAAVPGHSGYIILLQNRVRLNSAGNNAYKTMVYYDSRTRCVGADEKSCTCPFRTARLKNGQMAAGWMESG